jgi:FkbM family methyltransferase
MRRILKIINDFMDRAFGKRIHPSPEARLSSTRNQLIAQFACNIVIDVGANSGQWAKRLRDSGYRGQIISYEPSNAFNDLEKKTQKDSFWHAKKLALSNYSGFSTFFVASNSNLSSSILQPKEILNHHSGIQFKSEIQVPIKRLDSEAIEGSDIYLKIDAQGSEFNVLQGSLNLLPHISIIEFESALEELYEGEKSHHSISAWLINQGFQPKQIVVTHCDSQLDTISIDSIFSRPKQA